MKILVSGHKGFLISSVYEELSEKYEILNFSHNTNYIDIDTIIHFASPSDTSEFLDKEKTSKSMIDLSLKIIEIAKLNNAKLIFASSEAVNHIYDECSYGSYGIYKLCIEQYIQDNLKNYLILRIPRVYGKNREKGIIKKLKDNTIPESDLLNTIKYIDIEDFKEWFLRIEQNNGLLVYDRKYRLNTIQELKKIYGD